MPSRTKQKLKTFYDLFVEHFVMAQISFSASTLAYYTLLSLFPALLIIGNILPMMGLNANVVLSYVQPVVPNNVFKFIRPLVADYLSRGNGGELTIGLVVALWSTSNGFAAFQRSVNQAYGVALNQNPLINRGVAFLWTIVLLALVFAIAFVYGLGEQILRSIQPIFHFNYLYIKIFGSLKFPVTFIVLFISLSLLYYLVPNARILMRYVWPGTLLVTLGWMGLSKVFSLYTNIFSNSITSSKTIGAFIVLMIWMDFSGMIIMVGAVLNASLQMYFEGEIHEKIHLWQWASFNRYRHRHGKNNMYNE